MQRVHAVVRGERVAFAIERKFSVRNAVAVAANQRAKIRRRLDVAVQVVETQHDVGELAGFIRRLERRDDAAVSHDRRRHAVTVAQRIKFNGLAFRRLTEIRLRDGSFGSVIHSFTTGKARRRDAK